MSGPEVFLYDAQQKYFGEIYIVKNTWQVALRFDPAGKCSRPLQVYKGDLHIILTQEESEVNPKKCDFN